jgi:hypothetical protein
MKSNYLKYLLAEAEVSQADIGRRIGQTRANVCAVVNGLYRSEAVEKEIASVIGMKSNDIWPLTKN